MKVHRHYTNAELGEAAALHAAASLTRLAAQQDVVSIVFATGASQLETLKALTELPGLPWDQVIGFHMDEYIGISRDHPASFRRYLQDKLVDRVPLRAFYFVDGNAERPEDFAWLYADLLSGNLPQLCLGGIGENGHLAFNDPPVADFNDPLLMKVVELDRDCRRQQVNEGWFASLEEVPSHALTLTIPALMQIPEIILSVPGERKARIVERTLDEEISTRCPATVLQSHPNAHLYLDSDSARYLR